MIQFNLLPDVKLEYIKAERTRRLIFAGSFLVSCCAIGLLIVLLSVSGLQKKHIKDLDADITSETSQLKGKPQISKILTVQNQLSSLTMLHASKPAASQLFGYLNQVTPTNVSISNFSIDFTTFGATFSGSTDSLSSVNKYVDTLKYTKYTADDAPAAPAFTNVVLSSYALSPAADKKQNAASYSISLSYDKTIFDITKKVTLTVPTLTTTRNSQSSANDLFQAAPTTTTPATTTTKAGN